MNDEQKSPAWDKIAREYQRLGMSFTVGLAFAVLAASVQTFSRHVDTSVGKVALGLELFGWLFLLVSGIAGILWMYFAPEHYFSLHNKSADQCKNEYRSRRSQHCHRLTLIAGLILLSLARAMIAVSG